VPRVGHGDKYLLMFPSEPAKGVGCLLGNLASFAFDYVARQKSGSTSLKYYLMKQLTTLPPKAYEGIPPWAGEISALNWIYPRVLELSFISHDLAAAGRDLGYEGRPFHWDKHRRFLLRCELDAAFFHLYLPTDERGDWVPARQADGCPHDETDEQLAELKRHFPTPRHAVDYILDTFPIVRRKDEKKYGEYRTKRVILEIYDEMQQAIATGEPYQTRLDPPPADPRVAHGN